MLTRELRLHNSSLLLLWTQLFCTYFVLHSMSETCCRCACRQPHVAQLFLLLLLRASPFSKETCLLIYSRSQRRLGVFAQFFSASSCFLHFPPPSLHTSVVTFHVLRAPLRTYWHQYCRVAVSPLGSFGAGDCFHHTRLCDSHHSSCPRCVSATRLPPCPVSSINNTSVYPLSAYASPLR